MSDWIEAGHITTDQARAIATGYGVDFDAAKHPTGAYGLLVGLGYLFVGLALITLIGANWEEIPRELRLGAIVGVTMLTHLNGLRHFLNDRRTTALALFFLGNLFYGASIALTAQIYHLGEHMPDGIFIWALGTLPFGLALRSPWLTLVSLSLGLLWFFVELEVGFYPLAMPIFLVAAVYVLRYASTSLTLFLSTAASIGVWLEVSLAELWSDDYGRNFEPEHLFIGAAYVLLCKSFGQWLSQRSSVRSRDYGVALSLWSLRFALVSLFILSFEFLWEELIEADFDYLAHAIPWLIALFAGAIAFGWRSGHGISVAAQTIAMTGVMTAAVAITDSSHAVLFQVAANLLLVASGAVLIWRGIEQAVTHYFYLGIGTILFTGFLRYVDLIGGYVGSAVLFLAMAGVLIGAARFWRYWNTRTAQ